MSELLTVKIVLACINLRLVELRRALGHRHDDEPWWKERGQTVQQAQKDRRGLRWDAHLLHVERATRRGRIHGTFVSLDAQREWLAKMQEYRPICAEFAGVPSGTTLVTLRAGIALEVAA